MYKMCDEGAKLSKLWCIKLFVKYGFLEKCSWYNLPPRLMGGLHVSRVNTLRPRQNGRHFAEDIFKCIFMNENVWFPIKLSLKFVPKGLIKNIPELVQIMAWRRSGNKPLSEAMMVSLPTHIWVARPQWVNTCQMGSGINRKSLMYDTV